MTSRYSLGAAFLQIERRGNRGDGIKLGAVIKPDFFVAVGDLNGTCIHLPDDARGPIHHLRQLLSDQHLPALQAFGRVDSQFRPQRHAAKPGPVSRL